MFKVSLNNGHKFDVADTSSILDEARAANTVLEYSCRTGRCGVCKAPLLSGETSLLQPELGLEEHEYRAGMILTCCRAAQSDITLDVADLGKLANIRSAMLPCRIALIDFPSPTVAKVMLRLPPTTAFEFLPGQYINVIAGGVKRAYSIANAPRDDRQLTLYIRRFDGGEMSRYWFGAAKVGDLLRLEGPLGTFYLRESPPKTLVFLATGTGIAPVKAVLEEIAGMDGAPEIVVYWGNREPQDFFWTPEDRRVRFVPLVSGAAPSWDGRRGYVQDGALEDFPSFADCAVYACGSEAMIHAAIEPFVDRGLPRRHFHYDAFVRSN